MATIKTRERAKGKISFLVYYRDQEGDQHIKAFTSKNSTKSAIRDANKAAEKFAAKIEAEKALGILEIETNQTFKEYSEQFMEIHLHNKRPNTVDNYTKYLGYINQKFGTKKLPEITATELDNYFLSLKKRGLKISSLKLYRDILNLVLKSAKKKHLIKYNPMLELDFDFKDTRKKEVKSVDEDTLRTILNSFQMDYYIHLLLLGIMTGMRLGELCSLTWDRVDFNKKIIEVRTSVDTKGRLGPTKTNSGMRDIYMYDNLLFLMFRIQSHIETCKEKLGNTYQNHNLVICKYDDKPLKTGQVSKTMYEKSITYGVHFTMHKLRHTFGTHLKTANVKDVQNLLGHAKADMTVNTYQDFIELDKKTVNLLNTTIDPSKYLS
ncbi:site-specific integrase [Mycoplasmatota bacterium]|nr:site-specific integrase [Mycoplasmatota bacterium]